MAIESVQVNKKGYVNLQIDIPTIANKVFEEYKKHSKNIPYNAFEKWHMSENDHTKLLLALFRYQDSNGHFPVLYSFLDRFTKGRGKAYYCSKPPEVEIEFSPRYSEQITSKKKLSFVDGLIYIQPEKEKGRRIAIIIENKIYDAADQADQIRRYIRLMIERNVVLEDIWAIYITSDGSKEIDRKKSYDPDGTIVKETNNIGRHFIPLNYNEDILTWLKDDILKPRIKPIYPETLTSIVRSYVDYLENHLMSISSNEFEECRKVFFKELQLKTNLDAKNISEAELRQLYLLLDVIKEQRNIRGVKEQDNPNSDATSFLYRLLKRTLNDIEIQAFDNFEKTSERILKNKWKKATWKVAHRGNMGGDNGYIQLRVTDDWDSVHLEWWKISTAKFLFETDYTIELHVEGKQREIIREEWRKESYGANIDGTSPCPKYQLKEHTRKAPAQFVFGFKIKTDEPMGRIKQKDLEVFLDDLYNNKLYNICRMLVKKKDEYA